MGVTVMGGPSKYEEVRLLVYERRECIRYEDGGCTVLA